MRVFAAIPLGGESINRILAVCDALRLCGSGNFTRRENLHITLEFLGELPAARVATLQAIISGIEFPSFDIAIGRKLGCFGDLWWLSIESRELFLLQGRQHEDLLRAGFEVESRPYRPHLTLVRQFRPQGVWDRNELLSNHPPFVQRADRIILFQSERLNGRLTYTPIETKYLK